MTGISILSGLCIVGLFAALGVVGCNGRDGPPAFEGLPVRVVCTTTIVADVVGRVGGDRVAVETLMGPGVDPHKYISGAGDRGKLDHAHLVFFSGLHLEGKMTDLFEKNSQRWRAYAITDTIPHEKLRSADVDGGEHDPHVWFDVQLWKYTVNSVRDKLAALDPAGEGVYRKNAAEYLAELDGLHKEICQSLDTVPSEKRVLVTSHDAFEYFGHAYGFEVIALQGVSTASEATTRQRDKLAQIIGERRIPAVFTETSVPPEILQGALDDVYAKHRHRVRLIEGEDALFSDALGQPGSAGGTYTGMIRHNVRVIVEALRQ